MSGSGLNFENKTCCAQRNKKKTNLQLLGVNGAGSIRVEEVERLADLLLLLLGESGGAALALVAASGTNSLEREAGKWERRSASAQLIHQILKSGLFLSE